MLNRYPLWKNFFIISVLIISIIYALPNFFGEDPAIQIVGVRGNLANKEILNQIVSILQKEKVDIKSVKLKNDEILICFDNVNLQLNARDILLSNLKENYVIALNLAPLTPHWLKFLGAEPMKLGLDLRGGVHFLISVDIDKILNQLQEYTIDSISNDLRKQKISYSSIRKINNYGIEVRFHDNYECLTSKNHLKSLYNDFFFEIKSSKLIISLKNERFQKARDYALSQNLNIIRNRINQLGIMEPLIQRQGDCIIVELPGIQDTARAKEILSATAMLEFRLVNTDIDNNSFMHNFYIPPNDSEIKYTRDGHSVLLYKKIILTGDHITNAKYDFDDMGNAQVSIILDHIGGSIMSNFTRDHQNKIIATLLVEYKDTGKKNVNGDVILVKDEKIINIAKISSYFSNKFRITGISNPTEARQLSLLLRSGALVAPIKIIQEITIGPALGLQNIKEGIKASLSGLLISMLFLVIYYRKFGIIASFALLANLVLIAGIMSILPGVALTMPGIAGIVLIVAISVDATVLINERIKEELRNGRSVQQAINEGYRGSFSSILDANLTTGITSIILYLVGSGFIKGFAITTIIGILTSMFTSIILTRAFVNLLYGGKKIKKLSI
ncbi:MAG: protein translocase subunit SecD [Arsenophonus sp.]|nr:MAG: protein translocase subunit SecD [Arsenophonus sp.]